MSVLENESTFIISYNPQCVESLRQGLQRYQQLIQRKDAFKNEFCQITYSVQKSADTTTAQRVEDSESKVVFDINKFLPPHILSELSFTSEADFFMGALQYPELEGELEQAAMAIKNVSRRFNDSADMWASDEEVMGLQPLLMISLKYPKYTYLLAGYIIPYWDTEHAPIGEEILTMVTAHHGYTHDMLKAFCYCDNHNARYQMFTTGQSNLFSHHSDHMKRSLLDIFRSLPEEFELFKQMLKERFADQEYLQYTDDSRYYNDTPISSMLHTIAANHYVTEDGEFDEIEHNIEENIGEKWFIDSSVYETAKQLKSEVESYLGRPIVKPQGNDGDEKKYSDNYYTYNTATEQWKALILGEFSIGPQIWDYITTGNSSDILDQIEPCDISVLIENGNYKLVEKTRYFIGAYDTFQSELKHIIYDLILDWTRERDEDDELNQAEDRFKLFRMLDVLHRWNGKQGFDPDFINEMVDEYEFFDSSEFYQRYSGNWKTLFFHYIESFSGYSSNIEKKEASQLYQLILEHRDEVNALLNDDILGDEQSKETNLALCAAIAYFDQNQGVNDLLTQKVLHFLNQNLCAEIYCQIAQTSEFTCAPKESWSVQKPSAEELKQIEQDWQIVEQYLTGKHQDTHAAITRFAKHQQTTQDDDDIFYGKTYYQFLRDFDDKAQKLLVAAQVIAKYSESPIQLFAGRFIELWLHLAPIKTCRMLAHFYNNRRYYGDIELIQADSLALVNQLNGITEVGATAYQLETLIDWADSDTDFQTLYTPYFKQYQNETSLPKEQRVLHRALKELLPHHTQEFMAQLYKFDSGLAVNYFDQTLADIVTLTIEQRIQRPRYDQQGLTDEQKQKVAVARHYMSLTTAATQDQITQLSEIMQSRYINDFKTPWGAAKVSFLFKYASTTVQENLLRLYINVPSMSITDLESDDDSEQQIHICKQALKLGANKLKLFELVINERWSECLELFPNHKELVPLASDMKTSKLYALLEQLAKFGCYEEFIAGFKDHPSQKIRDLIIDIEAGHYCEEEELPIQIVDFGIYAESGTPEQVEEARQALIDAGEVNFTPIYSLEHRKETLLIESGIDLMFGMRIGYFELDDDTENELPETRMVTVRVHHPHLNRLSNDLTEWDLTLTLGYSTYAGWTMKSQVPGIYRIDILDEEQSIILSKTFHVVKKKPFLTDELIEQYQSDELQQRHIGNLNVSNKQLDIVDVYNPCDTLGISHTLSTNMSKVYTYTQESDLRFCELRLNEDTPTHWYVASNNLRAVVEKQVIGQQLVIGSTVAIKQALAQPETWQDELNVNSPVHLLQPDEAQADRIVALHLKKKGFRLLLGYSSEGELCRLLIAHQKVGLIRRLFLALTTGLAQSYIKNYGEPKVL